jgi:hypothetical protein
MLDTHPKTGQDHTHYAVLQARRILDAVYTREQLDTMPPARILNEAQAFEDARGAARSGLGA